MTELWRSVRGFNEYEVSSIGRVRSVDRISQQIRHGKSIKVSFRGRIIQTSFDRRGYEHITLWRNNRPTGFTVHRLVAEAFLHEIGEGEQVNHLDCNKRNNELSNLEITTPEGNILHGTRAGRFARKLSDETVREIKFAKMWGDNHSSLANRFGVSRAAIRVVTASKVWKRIDLSEWQLGHE